MTLPAIVIRLELEQPPRLYIDAEHEGDAHRLMRWLDGSSELLDLVVRAQSAASRRRVDERTLSRLGRELFGFAGSVVLPWGRHRGRSIAEVYADDPVGRARTSGIRYVRWLSSDAVLDSHVREAARRFLEDAPAEPVDR